MRRSRWLILAILLSIVGFVGATFLKRRELLSKDAPATPSPLEASLDGRANDWVYTESDGVHPRVTIRAKSVKQVRAPSVMELQGVELQLFHQDGEQFDLVKSATAEFDMAAKTLFSEGQVDISMGVPADGVPKGRILKIHSSGVRFASDSGKAWTDKPATFELDLGSGGATGVEYDPGTRELHLRSQVSIDWTGKTSQVNATQSKAAPKKPMHIEAGEAYYREEQSTVTLQPWSKLTRDTLHMEAGVSVVTLDSGAIQSVDSMSAHGVQSDPDRKVEFGADHLVLAFGDGMQIQTIKGERNGKLISTSSTMRTTVTADTLNLDFAPAGEKDAASKGAENKDVEDKDRVLSRAVATGKSMTEAKPIPVPGELLADTRILRSETLRLKMRPGGRDIETVETDGPGTVDFLPNRLGQPKRFLKGDRIWIAYGAENRIESFRSINASTRTDKTAINQPGKAASSTPLPPMLTSSKELLALFDPKTSELARLEQKTDFHYEEGVRRATADKATLEEAKNLITLEGTARSWDPTGSAAADRILMNQMSGDVVAEGHVATTHMPDQPDPNKPDNGKANSSKASALLTSSSGAEPSPAASSSSSGSTALLSTTEIMQGRSQRMTSAEKNHKLHYEGNAVVWQGANRVEADRIDIDRTHQIFEAHGKVISQFVDKSKDSDPAKGKERAKEAAKAGDKASDKEAAKATDKGKTGQLSAPIFTVVRAPDLLNTGDTRLAHYQGGAAMTRPDLTVTGKEIQAYLNEAGADNSLDKAIADGTVKIVSTAEKRNRTGTSDHAEYYTTEQKVVLTKGDPLLVDSIKGRTRGNQLTWWANNDRLLVDGVPSRPADSLLRKK